MGYSPEGGSSNGRYSPYSKEGWARIKKLWDGYRSDVGLESDHVHGLVGRGANDRDVEEALDLIREETEPKRQKWLKDAGRLLKESHQEGEMKRDTNY